MRKDGMTGMPRRRGRPCAWPPARGVCGVPPPLKPPFEIGDPLEVMNSMYTDQNKTEVRRTVAPWATGSPSAEDDVRTTSRIPREPKRYAHFLQADAHLCRRRVERRERACELRVHKWVHQLHSTKRATH